MHELSIAMSIVDLAVKEARAASASSVAEVELDIGTLSGIEFISLEFGLKAAVRGTILEHTEFKINRIEPLAECLQCKHLFIPGELIRKCPECNQTNTSLIRGRELQIKSLLVE
jgi:hydrogenase nickel incorporation protein HypA/HybF